MAVTSLARFSRLLLTATLALLSVACGSTGIQTTTRPTGPTGPIGLL